MKVIKPTPKQIEAKNISMLPEKQVVLYGGAIRGGKSYWLILMFHSLAMMYPKSKWLLLRESFSTLERTLIPTFRKLLADGLQPYIKSFDQKNYVVNYHNGSQLIFMSENYDQDKELNRFRGLEINGAGIDEINETRKETFIKIIERSGSHIIDPMPPIKVLGTCNPTQGWVKEDFYNRYLTDTLPSSWAYIPAKITDNPYIPESYLESLRENLPPLDYQKFVEGDWDIVMSENPFAYEYKSLKHESDKAVYIPGKAFKISFDFNLNPFGCIFFHLWRDSEGEHLHIFDEMTIEMGNIPVMVERILSRYGDYMHLCEITGDDMGNRRSMSERDFASLYDQLLRGLKMNKSQLKLVGNPTHENSRSDTNYILFKFPDFKINPKTCKNTCSDMKMVQCDAFGAISKKNRNDLTQRADHLDCVRYAINTFLKKWILSNRKF
jgi:Terminase large subunit, T4likevirus-type, N-terminal